MFRGRGGDAVQGKAFRLRIVIPSTVAPGRQEGAPPASRGVPGRGCFPVPAMPKILVVDDKHYVRQLLVTALGLKGYQVLAAGDGWEGLEVARRERPDLILLDVVMPRTGGLEVLRALRASPDTATIPVVLMSARSDLDPLALPPGVAGYLFKPFDLDHMEAVLAELLPGAAEAAAGSAGGPVAGA